MLHILIICDTLVHTRIARLLLQMFPRLAVDKIEGEEYLGNLNFVLLQNVLLVPVLFSFTLHEKYYKSLICFLVIELIAV